MNDYRRDMVERVFIILDRTGTGLVSLSDLKHAFNPKKHPDVIQGRKSADQVLMEFMETFEMHHNLNSKRKDGRVSQSEFLDYYDNVSAAIDSDDFFQILINNSWNLSGGPLNQQNLDWETKSHASSMYPSEKSLGELFQKQTQLGQQPVGKYKK